jgi:hypothetical protein
MWQSVRAMGIRLGLAVTGDAGTDWDLASGGNYSGMGSIPNAERDCTLDLT